MKDEIPGMALALIVIIIYLAVLTHIKVLR